MKKRALVVFGFFALMLLIAGVFAANNTTSTNASTSSDIPSSPGTSGASSETNVDKGYQCLEGQIKDKAIAQLSLQDAIFSTLALGSRANLQSKIDSEKKNGESCWPKTACTIRETAQVMLAYDKIGKNNKDVEAWINSKNGTSSDLTWYLEIDIANHQAAECTLSYDGSGRKINILPDMRIEGNPGSCFSISSSGYWLTAKENCFNKEIQVSCNQDFVTAQIYEKKSGAGTIYVSSKTQSAAALGSTTEIIDSRCFKSGTSCDYEGTLWASLALHKAGKDISAYIPYLLALAENNQKYFPNAFIYSIIGGEDQYTQIIQQQRQGRSWKIIGSPYNEFYDTSLGMLALGSSSASSGELESTKSYLLSIQAKEGCWNNNNVRDTAFILYSGWGRAGAIISGSGGGSTLCKDVAGQACEIYGDCIDAGGRILSNFQCSGGSVCCSQAVNKPSCREQQGILCSSSQLCDGRAVQSGESGICCLDSCIEAKQENTCEISGGTCANSCGDNEEIDDTNKCLGNEQVCCVAKEKKGGSAWIWILLLLILLLILAIIFRNKLRIWWYKYKGKAKITPITRPGSPEMSFGLNPERFKPRLPLGNYRPASRPQLPGRKPASKDSEMEETLKKLRDISK